MRISTTLTAIAIIAVAASVPLSLWLLGRGASDTITATGSAATSVAGVVIDKLAALFGSHDEKSFTSHLTSVIGRDGDELLVATRKAVIQADASSNDFLGGSKVSASVPYTAHYTIRISSWTFASAGGTLFVRQPAISVLSPVSIAVEEIGWSTNEALVHFGRGSRLRNDILQSIQLEANADAVNNRQQVKSEANKATEAFIRTWLSSRDPALREELAQRIVFVDELPECPTPPVRVVASPPRK